MAEEHVLDVAGRELVLTSPDKVFFSERQETKLDLVQYYLAVAEPLMRATGGRPTLMQRFPQSKITVENLGIGGQLAVDMLRRIKKDVIPRKPTLVIWQTGVNDAMRRVPVDKFRETVIAGVDELQRAGIDVVLLDMQYFPKAEKVRDFPRFLVAMRQIAEQRRIPILQRVNTPSGDFWRYPR